MRTKYPADDRFFTELKANGFKRKGSYLTRRRGEVIDRIQASRSPWYHTLDVSLLIGPNANPEAFVHESNTMIPDYSRWNQVTSSGVELSEQDNLFVDEVAKIFVQWFDRFPTLLELILYARLNADGPKEYATRAFRQDYLGP